MIILDQEDIFDAMYGELAFVLVLYILAIVASIYFIIVYVIKRKKVRPEGRTKRNLYSNLFVLIIIISPILHLYWLDYTIEKKAMAKLQSVSVEEALGDQPIFVFLKDGYIANEKIVTNSQDVTIIFEINIELLKQYNDNLDSSISIEEEKRGRTNYLLETSIEIHDELWRRSLNFDSITVKLIDFEGNLVFQTKSTKDQFVIGDRKFDISLYKTYCSYDTFGERFKCSEIDYRNWITYSFTDEKRPIINIKFDPYEFIDILK